MIRKISGISLASVLFLGLVACSVDQVIANIDIALQGAQNIGTVVSTINPADGDIVETAAATIIADLGLIKSLYDGWASSGATTDLNKIQAAVEQAEENQTQIEMATHLFDPASKIAFAAFMEITDLALDTVVHVVGGNSTPQSAFNAATGFASVGHPKYSAKDLKRKWDNNVCKGEKACRDRVKIGKKK